MSFCKHDFFDAQDINLSVTLDNRSLMATYKKDKTQYELVKSSKQAFTGAKKATLSRAPRLPKINEVYFKRHCRNMHYT